MVKLTAIVRRGREVRELLFLVKLPQDQGFEFGQDGGGVVALDVEGDFAAGAGGQHHQAHDALAVDLFAVLFHKDVAGVAIGDFGF